ncbi:MAG: biopolymer transporter ExbD [Pseudomonadota bacterium]|nr:protein TolR [Hyphomicrobiales bacterium]MAP06891.1 protein TolR [Rhodobiaceae bacterium]MEC7928635.1 biopolymer transporter ExbD [Pseudomonadota bacterium]MBC24963.1 protein TolR [Rhodobiaceae bacterium]MBS70050.1 protein TolR [Rhodobiaceae bacterium]|tara:strand:- start:58 stop:492 length:435 start_codon:yes stop_codon:yes gene_type:complete
MATNIKTLPNNRRRSRKNNPISDINVTPLVDVMLVLLIVFMVTAPLLTVGVPIELPKTSAKQMTDDNEPLTITIDKNSKIYIQEMEIDFDDLTEKLEAIGQSNFDQKIYINGDKDISYEVLMRVMAKISSSGYTSIGLVTDIES